MTLHLKNFIMGISSATQAKKFNDELYKKGSPFGLRGKKKSKKKKKKKKQER